MWLLATRLNSASLALDQCITSVNVCDSPEDLVQLQILVL